MWGEYHILEFQQLCRWLRLTFIDIEAGTTERALSKRSSQRGGINRAAARNIDQKTIGAERLQHPGIDQMARGRAARRGDDQHVAPACQLQHAFKIAVIDISALASVEIADFHIEGSRAAG